LAASITIQDITCAVTSTSDKELHEAPDSMRKTLRGRIAPSPRSRGAWPRCASARVADGLPTVPSGGRRHGQGTAAVAGQAISAAAAAALARANVDVGDNGKRCPDSALSGHVDTLVIAISQSGTTDTNRTVDLVRRRGAIVIAIVNRRGSDLTSKADGVLYTPTVATSVSKPPRRRYGGSPLNLLAYRGGQLTAPAPLTKASCCRRC
jgi:glucosamine--fructose-6-phosphate aminotransferase (isomerizing)